MSGTDPGPEGSARRWWEIRGDREPDEGRYGDLVTGGRGRSRPERSLAIGANPAEASSHPLRRFLWPVVSVVAVGVLIVGGVYAVPKLRSEPASDTTSPVAAVPDSGRRDVVGGLPGLPTPVSTPPSAVGGALPPFGGADGVPGSLGSVPGSSPGGVGGSEDDQGEQSASRQSAPPPVEPGGPAPADPAPADPAPAPERDRLSANEQLNASQRLVSPNGQFVLLMQDNGNLVEYASDNGVVWATGTSVPDSILRVQDDGNVVVIAPGNRPVWATGTDGNPNVTLELQDDGNLVVYAQGHQAVWSTGVP